VLPDRSVEKAHAQVYLADDDAVYVTRLGSGEVVLNGRRVGDFARLKNTDIVCFGSIVARVHLKEAE
jgi:predicted component of type VI protein secretion system